MMVILILEENYAFYIKICQSTPLFKIYAESKFQFISGWSLNEYRVQKVQVYFDSIEKDATIGQARTDVDKVFPEYALTYFNIFIFYYQNAYFYIFFSQLYI